MKREEQTHKAGQDMRTRILNTASELMLKKGIQTTSVNDIAQAVGISKGTLYYYYSAKDDIIFDIAERNLKQITDEFHSWAEKADNEAPPMEKIKGLFQQVLAEKNRARLHLYLMGEALNGKQTLAERFKKRYEEYLQALQAALDAALGKAEKNADLARLLLAALDGLLVQELCGVGQKAPIDGIVNLLFGAADQ